MPEYRLNRQQRLANADRVLAQQPGAARHAAEIAERRRLAQMAAESGGTITEAQLGEATTPASMALLSRVPISNQAAYTKRRKPPSQFRGGLSAAIAGLGAPMGYEAPAPAEPDFEARPEDPSLIGRQVAQARALQENEAYQANLADRQAREDQIRANIQLRAAGGGADPYAGLEMSPAEFRLLSRRNPALYVQARGQQADRFARSEAEQALADYRNDQTVLAREGLRDRRQQFAEEQRRLRDQAELQFGGQMSDVDRELLGADLASLLSLRKDGKITDRQYQQRRAEIEARVRGTAPPPEPRPEPGEPVSYTDAATNASVAATHPGVRTFAGENLGSMSKLELGRKLWDALSDEGAAAPDAETLTELRSFIMNRARIDPEWAASREGLFGRSPKARAQLELIDKLLEVTNPSPTYLGGFKNWRSRQLKQDNKRALREGREAAMSALPIGG